MRLLCGLRFRIRSGGDLGGQLSSLGGGFHGQKGASIRRWRLGGNGAWAWVRMGSTIRRDWKPAGRGKGRDDQEREGSRGSEGLRQEWRAGERKKNGRA